MPESEPVFLASNRSYRYGDGLFETLRCRAGKVLLEQLHFDRLFSGLDLLRLEMPGLFSRERLVEQILQLCARNACSELARVRLSVYRGDGGLYDRDPRPGYLIECWPLDPLSTGWNTNGLVLGIFEEGRKAVDAFSPVKSANALIYSLAARFALAHQWNEALVLNPDGRIADATTANLFMIRDGIVTVPPVTEGGVAGVMRRFLLMRFQEDGVPFQERPLTPGDLVVADEVFLTNAIRGIRWVQRIGDRTYGHALVRIIYDRFIRTI
ncbi:MAG: hypothetical protein RJA57_1821 [Bacteroidota bacterium]